MKIDFSGFIKFKSNFEETFKFNSYKSHLSKRFLHVKLPAKPSIRLIFVRQRIFGGTQSKKLLEIIKEGGKKRLRLPARSSCFPGTSKSSLAL